MTNLRPRHRRCSSCVPARLHLHASDPGRLLTSSSSSLAVAPRRRRLKARKTSNVPATATSVRRRRRVPYAVEIQAGETARAAGREIEGREGLGVSEDGDGENDGSVVDAGGIEDDGNVVDAIPEQIRRASPALSTTKANTSNGATNSNDNVSTGNGNSSSNKENLVPPSSPSPSTWPSPQPSPQLTTTSNTTTAITSTPIPVPPTPPSSEVMSESSTQEAKAALTVARHLTETLRAEEAQEDVDFLRARGLRDGGGRCLVDCDGFLEEGEGEGQREFGGVGRLGMPGGWMGGWGA